MSKLGKALNEMAKAAVRNQEPEVSERIMGVGLRPADTVGNINGGARAALSTIDELQLLQGLQGPDERYLVLSRARTIAQSTGAVAALDHAIQEELPALRAIFERAAELRARGLSFEEIRARGPDCTVSFYHIAKWLGEPPARLRKGAPPRFLVQLGAPGGSGAEGEVVYGLCPRCGHDRFDAVDCDFGQECPMPKGSRTHEECVGCPFEREDPQPCNGHLAGPSPCADRPRLLRKKARST